VKIRNLIFDFDGVMAESNNVRFKGFEELYAGRPESLMNEFMVYVKSRGGLSRYAKIRKFFELAENRVPSESEVRDVADRYSALVKKGVVRAPAVKGAVEFLESAGDGFGLALVSGSDQEELRSICRERGIDKYFQYIYGSPVEKPENLTKLMKTAGWPASECVYIGDARDDLRAAESAGMSFIGRNSGLFNWRDLDKVPYVDDLTELSRVLTAAFA
jgi:phosphoglycolate phosphatase-like HAD superfamily hydrolase